MTKKLAEAVMTQSRLNNKYAKEKSADSKIAFDKQRNYCVNLLSRTKKNRFAKINISSTRSFGKLLSPFFE